MDWETSLEIHELHARLCKAIADPKRLLIINELRHGAMTVNELAEALEMSQSNTSQHLAVLREKGLVDTRKQSQAVFYRVAEGPVHRIIQTLHDIYCPVGIDAEPASLCGS